MLAQDTAVPVIANVFPKLDSFPHPQIEDCAVQIGSARFVTKQHSNLWSTRSWMELSVVKLTK